MNILTLMVIMVSLAFGGPRLKYKKRHYIVEPDISPTPLEVKSWLNKCYKNHHQALVDDIDRYSFFRQHQNYELDHLINQYPTVPPKVIIKCSNLAKKM